jgi:hypothetical protein
VKCSDRSAMARVRRFEGVVGALRPAINGTEEDVAVLASDASSHQFLAGDERATLVGGVGPTASSRREHARARYFTSRNPEALARARS